MGDGVFVRAVGAASVAKGFGDASVTGVEYSRAAFEISVRQRLQLDHAIHGDFMAVEPVPVDAVVGNPPYVRLRHLPPSQAQRARAVAQRVLGRPMDPSGSVWMPFVLHAAEFLKRGGRLAFVLPFDLTYVRYARPLWAYLGDHFGALRVVRVRERMFPEILQEAVLLFASDFGGCTKDVTFAAFETCDDLLFGDPGINVSLRLSDLLAGERVFAEALLDAELRHLLRGDPTRDEESRRRRSHRHRIRCGRIILFFTRTRKPLSIWPVARESTSDPNVEPST